jgi:1-acyl-sn-glycerol-3-phosphate acyltransferase
MYDKMKALFFSLFMAVWITISFGLGLILAFSFQRRIIALAGHIMARGVLLFQRVFFGIKVQVSGLEHIPKGPFILVAKHQSAWETGYFFALFPNTMYILKKEITYMPIFGWLLLLMGMICINRKASVSSIRQIIKGVEKAYNDNRVVIIFPEGTRALPGERLPLKSGIVAIHQALPHIPIIAATHDSGKVWPKATMNLKPGTVHVKFLPVKLGARDELLKNIENAINSNPN